MTVDLYPLQRMRSCVQASFDRYSERVELREFASCFTPPNMKLRARYLGVRSVASEVEAIND